MARQAKKRTTKKTAARRPRQAPKMLKVITATAKTVAPISVTLACPQSSRGIMNRKAM